MRSKLAALFTIGGLLAFANAPWAADTLTIGYQTTVDPAKVAQADGAYEGALNRKIDWRKFDSGADVNAAIASGSIDIGYVGSSPLAAAASNKLSIETFFIATLIGDAEALVVRNGAGIKSPQDLVGKTVAVPFVSTAHYSLLAALKHWGIEPGSVKIINARPPEIAAAWARGDIDAAYVWDLHSARSSRREPSSPRRATSRNGEHRRLTPTSCTRRSPRRTRRWSPSLRR